MKNTVRLIVFFIIASMCANGMLFEKGAVAFAESGTTVQNLIFHNYSLIQKADDGSSYIYNGADTNGPQLATASQTTVNSQIKGQVNYLGIDFTYWSGMVIWGYQLTDDLHVQGNVQITVYMSSSDTISGLFSGGGYGMGLSDVDQNGNEIKRFTAEGPQSLGKNPLTGTPQAYTLNVQVDYIFPKDHAIAFFAGAGATKQGYKFTVYFDSPDKNSGATLPVVNPTPTPPPTPTPSPTPTTTPTITPSPNPTPSATPTPTLTLSPTPTPTPYPTPSPTRTPPPTAPGVTTTPSPTPTSIPTPTPTLSPSPTTIPEPNITVSPTHSPTPETTSTTIPTGAAPTSATPSTSSGESLTATYVIIYAIAIVTLAIITAAAFALVKRKAK